MSRGFGTTFGAAASDIVSSRYAVSQTGQRSYSIWSYRNANGGFNSGRMFDKNLSASTTGTEQFINAASPAGYHFKRGWSTSSFGLGDWYIQPQPSTGGWYHFLITYDASSTANTPIIYMNGVSQTIVTATAASGVLVNSTDVFSAGSGFTNANWDGMLAHFAIWDNILLTAGEARALANGAIPLLISSQNLVLYMPLDGINNPEFDFINGNSSSITGSRLGYSNPSVMPLSRNSPGWNPNNQTPANLILRRDTFGSHDKSNFGKYLEEQRRKQRQLEAKEEEIQCKIRTINDKIITAENRPQKQAKSQVNIGLLERRLAVSMKQLSQIEEELYVLQGKFREEDDIKAILMALNHWQ